MSELEQRKTVNVSVFESWFFKQNNNASTVNNMSQYS